MMIPPANAGRDAIKPRRFAYGLALVSALLCGFAAFFFFQELDSTLSDYSGGDAVWAHQVFYNMVHGRPLQTSVYRANGGGVEDNPHAYAHDFAIQTNLTMYLFAPLYALHQNLDWLYGIVFLINYAGIAFFMWKIISASKTPDPLPKTALAVSTLLLSCGFFWTLCYKAHPILFLGPFFFALYYFMSTNNDLGYYLTLPLILASQEDCALFMISWAGYLFLFRPGQRRRALITLAAAAAWVVFCVKLIQPAARHDMTLSATSLMVSRLKMVFDPANLKLALGNFSELARAVAAFAPMLVFSAAVFQSSPWACLPKILGMIAVAPASHWVVTLWTGGGEHWMPVLLCLLALNTALMCPQAGGKPLSGPKRKLGLIALAAFTLINAFGLYWGPIKLAVRREILPKLLHYPLPDDAGRIARNRKVIAYIESLPKDKKLCLLIDWPTIGFVADRSDFWFFPTYFADTDLLIMQRQITEYDYGRPLGERYSQLNGEQKAVISSLSDGKRTLLDDNLPKLADYLVKTKGSHRLIVDDGDLIVLERLRPSPISMPPSTLGLGFIRHP